MFLPIIGVFVNFFSPSACKSSVIVLTLLGGDGLVAARHLAHFGMYRPVVCYPKPPKKDLFKVL